jgi:hypothetical protein
VQHTPISQGSAYEMAHLNRFKMQEQLEYARPSMEDEIVSSPLRMIFPGLLLGACGGVACTAIKRLLFLAGVDCL